MAAKPARSIAWTGLLGALAGSATFTAVTAVALVDPGETSRLIALPMGLLAIGFLPAVWASLVATPRRERILRGTVVGCLGVVLAGTIVLRTLSIAVLLMIPTTLIAIAAGLVFQGRARR